MGVTIGLGSVGNRSQEGRLAHIGRIAQPRSGRLLRRQCRAGSLRDQVPLLLGQGGVEMEHEGIRVGPQLGHDERHPLRHQAADEGDVAAQAIQLGDDHRALRPPGCGQSGSEMGAAVQSIGTLARFDLDDFVDDGVAFRFREPANATTLRLDAEAAAPLFLRRHPDVRNGLLRHP
jgi:hypothetical protein